MTNWKYSNICNFLVLDIRLLLTSPIIQQFYRIIYIKFFYFVPFNVGFSPSIATTLLVCVACLMKQPRLLSMKENWRKHCLSLDKCSPMCFNQSSLPGCFCMIPDLQGRKEREWSTHWSKVLSGERSRLFASAVDGVNGKVKKIFSES